VGMLVVGVSCVVSEGAWKMLLRESRRLPHSFHDDGDIETRSECQFSYMSNSNH
jgi:hypothetical protein